VGNIKMNLKEIIGFEDVNWIHLVEERVQ